MGRKLIISMALAFLLATVLQAQQRQTQQRSTSSRSGSWSRSRTTTNRSTANVVSSVTRAPSTSSSSGLASRPASTGWGSGRASYNPIDPYARLSSRLKNVPGYRAQAWDLYYCDLFYSRLQMEFGYRGRDAFWTFAQGWPALTRQAADFAFQTSTRAADGILSLTAQLSHLLDQFESGEISQPVLEKEVKGLLNQIRQQTKKVRKDFYVSYLDHRQALEPERFEVAVSTEEMRELIFELRARALNLRSDFDQYFHEDRTRVISVKDLAQPSFKSRSKEIDKLAAAIKKSVVKL